MSTIETLNSDEIDRLLKHFFQKCYSPKAERRAIRDYTIILLMLDAGLRVGEVLTLRPSDLCFNLLPRESLTLSAEQTKTKTERTIPLSTRLKESIDHMIKFWWTPVDMESIVYAFSGPCQKRRLTVRAVELMLGRVSLSALGHSINPHVLRHTFATRLMRTVNIRIVQELLGHKALTSTQVYTHPNSVDLKKAIDGLA